MAITTLLEGLPNQSMAQAEFDQATGKFMGDLPTWGAEVNATAVDMTAKQQATVVNAVAAEVSKVAAAASAALAQSVAATSIAAVDLVATSTTSVTIGPGVKNFVIEPGKQFKPGMPVRGAFTAAPSNRVDGSVLSYDPATGAFSMQVEQRQGAGTSTAWTITFTGPTYQYQDFGGVSSNFGATSDIVLPAGMDKLQQFSAASGVSVQFANALDITAGSNVCELQNVSDDTYSCDVGLKDEDGTVIAYLPAGKSTACHLVDNLAPGTWAFPDAVPVAKPIRLTRTASTRVAGANGAFVRMVKLDADRLLFLVHGISLHGIIYEISTNSWGALTLIRTNWGGSGAVDNVRAELIGTDAVLVVSCPENSTGAQVCVLSVTGTSFLPGSPQSTVFGAASVRLLDLLIVGASYVIAYVAASNVLRMQARTISGTTVSAPGTEVVGTTGTAPPAVINTLGSAAGTSFSAITSTLSLLSVSGYSVSGTTIGTLTAVTATVTSIAGITVRQTPTGRYFITFINTTARIAAISFAAGTPSLSASAVISSVVTNPLTIQAQQLGFNVQTAVTGQDGAGAWVTEFGCVTDTGSGAPSLVGVLYPRTSPTAQTVAPTGTDDTTAASFNTASWMISTTKDVELHSFGCSNLVFGVGPTRRNGPMGVAAGLPPLAIYPKQPLHPSVLSKFGSKSMATLGDGSKPMLYSKALSDFGTTKTSPQLPVDPISGCKGVDQSSLWTAYSYGADAVVTLEEVKLA